VPASAEDTEVRSRTCKPITRTNCRKKKTTETKNEKQEMNALLITATVGDEKNKEKKTTVQQTGHLHL
jgi:hypothetical protein